MTLIAAAAAWRMPEARYVETLTSADSAMRVSQSRLEKAFGIGRFPRYDYDEGTGVLVFSDSGVAKVVADIQFVGEVSRRDSAWHWAWELPYVRAPLDGAARAARRYGWLHSIDYLRHSGWQADNVDGWEMTSLTAWIAGAEGAYRAPSSDSTTYTFMLLRRVRRAPPGRSVASYITSPRAGE